MLIIPPEVSISKTVEVLVANSNGSILSLDSKNVVDLHVQGTFTNMVLSPNGITLLLNYYYYKEVSLLYSLYLALYQLLMPIVPSLYQNLVQVLIFYLHKLIGVLMTLFCYVMKK